MTSQAKSALTLQNELEALNAIFKRIAERGHKIRTQAKLGNEPPTEHESPIPTVLQRQEIKQDSNYPHEQ